MDIIIDNYIERIKNVSGSFELIHSLEAEQMLFPEVAQFCAIRTYFEMLDIPLTCNPRSNAEFMSPGDVPFLVVDKELISGFYNITNYLDKKVKTLWPDEMTDEQIRDNEAECETLNTELSNIELYLSWIVEEYKILTTERYSFPFKWPLNSIQCWKKFRSIKKKLDLDDYLEKDLTQVLSNFDDICNRIDVLLKDKDFINGSYPTKLDALIFGHFFSILTTNSWKNELAEKVSTKMNIVNFIKKIDDLYFKRKD